MTSLPVGIQALAVMALFFLIPNLIPGRWTCSEMLREERDKPHDNDMSDIYFGGGI